MASSSYQHQDYFISSDFLIQLKKSIILYCNYQANRSYGSDTKTCQNLYKFDLEVKVHGGIGIMNVHDLSSQDMVIDQCAKYG